jgi:crotonobetainyl-CoA:carnitine CoA-transferase CaiB-like acyl-CoA transferase
MVPAQSRAFADQAPDGRYWRHAPVVTFSETPCEPGKPYCGLGEHTREVLQELGYDSAAIEGFREANVIGLTDQSSAAMT